MTPLDKKRDEFLYEEFIKNGSVRDAECAKIGWNACAKEHEPLVKAAEYTVATLVRIFDRDKIPATWMPIVRALEKFKGGGE